MNEFDKEEHMELPIGLSIKPIKNIRVELHQP